MSGRKRNPPPTALVPREHPDLSDADLAALIVQHHHLFGRKKLRAAFDPDADPRMQVRNEEDAVPGGSYLIFSETSQRFIGFRRDGIYHLDGSETSRRMQLVFYPAAQT